MQLYLESASFYSRRVIKNFFIVFLFLTSSLFSEEAYSPIAVYLTWLKSPESTMSIQWISKKEETENKVYYKPLNIIDGESPYLEQVASSRRMPEGHPFLIHQVELVDLDPDTAYTFKISATGELFKFKTMPKTLTEIKFVEGGDVYHDTLEAVKKMNLVAAKQNPLFAVLGGDLAYSADTSYGIFPEEFHRWMKWLVLWKKTMVTEEGFLIPILPAIGNHETTGAFNKTPSFAPFFYALFPNPGLPGYKVLDFGDYLSLFTLDSGHTNKIYGQQASWLAEVLESREKIPYKFAVYHVPAYPSVRSFSNEMSQSIRKHWVPLFETYFLRAAFEHHDHAYKRTFPLRNGRPHEKGVVYLGDGAWGIVNPRLPKQDRNYLARALQSSHFFLVTLNSEKVIYEAYNSRGEIIDRYDQKK